MPGHHDQRPIVGIVGPASTSAGQQSRHIPRPPEIGNDLEVRVAKLMAGQLPNRLATPRLGQGMGEIQRDEVVDQHISRNAIGS